jgi:hypothetical protein
MYIYIGGGVGTSFDSKQQPQNIRLFYRWAALVISVAILLLVWFFFFTYALLAGLRFTLAEDRFL